MNILKKIAVLLSILLLSGCAKNNLPIVETDSAVPSVTAPVIGQGTESPAPEESENTYGTDDIASITPTPAPEETTPNLAAILEPDNSDMVLVSDYIPDIQIELKYASEDNFTGEVIYDFNEAHLRYGTVKKLMHVQQSLENIGYGLKIWDAYRPVSAQKSLWEICPDPRYVANPETGSSSHSRGSAVDVTLIDSDGVEVIMPTGFDDFSQAADRDYSDVEDGGAENARLLETVMSESGMIPYTAEWWHFSDSDQYEVADNFIEGGFK